MPWQTRRPGKGYPMEQSPERLLTVTDIASELGVHVETVRRWIRSGELPALRFARKTGYRVRERDLQTFLARLETVDETGKAAA